MKNIYEPHLTKLVAPLAQQFQAWNAEQEILQQNPDHINANYNKAKDVKLSVKDKDLFIDKYSDMLEKITYCELNINSEDRYLMFCKVKMNQLEEMIKDDNITAIVKQYKIRLLSNSPQPSPIRLAESANRSEEQEEYQSTNRCAQC
jgi:hypothetical protein